MQPGSMPRHKLLEAINLEGRKMSMATILFHQAVAEKVGLTGTDHKYLDILLVEGPMTAGRLAELSGLTTGAVTGIIDRLEAQGLVNRVKDKNDRRKVMIQIQEDKAFSRLGPIFNSLEKELSVYYRKYSVEQLQTILSYLADCTKFFSEKSIELKSG